MVFTDQDLQDYLAGQALPERAAAIEAAVAEDEVLEARLMALDPFAMPVREAFASIQPDDAKTPTQATAQAPSGPARAYKWPALVAAALLAGLCLGLFLPVRAPAPVQQAEASQAKAWHHEVAAYQALYVPQTVATLDPTPDRIAAQFAQASRALGQALDPADFDAIDGLTLKRAQVLGYEGAPLVQIVYAAQDDTPVALCLMGQSAGDRFPENATLKGLGAVHWASRTLDVLLIGGPDADALRPAAALLRARLS